jgi:hypothetical protein
MPGGTSGADVQTGFVIKLGDNSVQMHDLNSPTVQIQHEVIVHKD